MKPCVIFDIDGTICDLTHRRHHVANKPKNWAAFNAGICADKPNEPIVRLLHTLSDSDHEIVLCSGREAVFRQVTEEWLARHKVCYAALYMRPAKDYRDDGTVKGELLDQILKDGWEPWLVVDDRSRVVKMWRERGLTCLQCADGDF